MSDALSLILLGLNRIGEDEEFQMTPRDGQLTLSKLAHHNRSFGSGNPYENNQQNAGLLTGRRSQAGRSEVGSTMSNKSVAESVISRATARKGKF